MKYLFTKRILLLLACLGLISFQSYGQSGQENLLPKITPKSPNVASLGRYGTYEVSLFTGLPTISIPLFEAKSGDLSVPITLNYHASGIRVTDQASWVGMGWTLNTGGAISRNIKGTRDESETGYLANFKEEVDGCADFYYLRAIAYSTSDGEPDVFSYSMPGKSGKFILQPDNEFITIPYDPIQIQKESALESFDLTDEKGVQYKFGKDKYGKRKVELGSQGKSAWMLTEMKAPNSDDYIEFTYKDGGQVQFYDLSSKVVVADGEQMQNALGQPVGPAYPVIESTNINQGGSTVVLYPEKIIFKNGEIRFYPSDKIRTDIAQNQYPLDRIEIYEKVNGKLSKIKTIKFLNTTYFTNARGEDVGLKLDGLQILDAEDDPVNDYEFSYHTNTFSWSENNTNPLLMRDFWGFYNGATINNTNNTLVPEQTIHISQPPNSIERIIGGADRSPNPAYLTEGVLKRITYPTGGYTEFSFEANKYIDKVENVEKMAGGLRIKSISSYDEMSESPIVKTYKYGLDESGVGNRNFFEGLAFYNFTTQASVYQFDGMTCYTNRTRTYVSSSMEQLNSYDGSPVVYPYVTEYQGTTDHHNGKIVYEFDGGSPLADNIEAVHFTGMFKRISNHWRRGHLSRKTTFDENNRKVAETVNSYTTLNYETTRVGLMAFETLTQEGTTPNEECPNQPWAGSCGGYLSRYMNSFSFYDLTSGVRILTSSSEHIFDQTHPENTRKVAKTVSYQYNDSLQLEQSKEFTSQSNEEIVTKFHYPQDYDTENNAIKKLQDQHIFTIPIEKYVINQNSDGANARVMSGQLTSYRENENNSGQVVPDKIYVVETTRGIPSADFEPSTASGSGFSMDHRYRPYATFTHYDAFGNIQELSKEEDISVVYLWGYNNTLPIAEINNATFDEVETAMKLSPVITFEDANGETFDDETLLAKMDLLRQRLPQAMISSYTHKPLQGIRSVTDAAGKTSYYGYDDAGRLNLVKDHQGNIVKAYNYNYRVY